MTPFVSALSIKNWAESLSARSASPQLVRKLIHGTVNDATKVDFPALESVQRSGFDGYVECVAGNTWVPAGKSVWEFGASKNKKPKADEDFVKRTEDVDPADRAEMTFIFVTPRHWGKKKSWAKDQAMLGKWKEVRAYDADDLEQWLETNPATAVWFAKQLGMPVDSVDDISSRWNAISNCSDWTLLPEVFLTSRDKEAKQLHEWLSRQAEVLTIETRTPGDVIDFVCAAAQQLKDVQRETLLARAVIVESVEAWRVLRSEKVPSVLLVDPVINIKAEELQCAVSQKHHVLVAANRPGRRSSNIELSRVNEFPLSQALMASGFDRFEAERFARLAGGSTSVLKRHIAKTASEYTPQWLAAIDPGILQGCLLVAGWSGNNLNDRRVLELLCNAPYEKIEQTLHRLATCYDPLFLHADGKWRLFSIDEAWSIAGNLIVSSSLAKYSELAIEILVDDDPKYGLGNTDRPIAHVLGHVPKYSPTIKEHLAKTLAFLGASGTSLELSSSIDVGGVLARIVSSVLPVTCEWERWASLGKILPLLAEASPGEFLDAVEGGLLKSEASQHDLFLSDNQGGFSECKHAGLLWALESLAWSRKYVTRASICLLCLDAHAGQMQWANTPRSSLSQILLSWMPQTTATAIEREKLLDTLIRKNKVRAIDLMLTLIGDSTHSVVMNWRPYWQDWTTGWQERVTMKECQRFQVFVAKRLLKSIGADQQRWKKLIEQFGQLPHKVVPQLLKAIRKLASSDLNDQDRQELEAILKEQIQRHRDAKDAPWSFDEDTVSKLTEICDSLAPRDSILKALWLFESYPRVFFSGGEDVSSGERALEEARANAIGLIVDEHGLDGVLKLAGKIKSPSEVGFSLAMFSKNSNWSSIVPNLIEIGGSIREFAGGFVWKCFYPENWEWLDSALKVCESPAQVAGLLSLMPFRPEIWNLVETKDQETKDLYWTNCGARLSTHIQSDVEFATEKLMQYSRGFDAIALLSDSIHRKVELPPELMLRALECLMNSQVSESTSSQLDRTRHAICKLIAQVQQSSLASSDRLMRVEFTFLNFLRSSSGTAPRALLKNIAASPHFFVELLSCCFRSRNEDQPEQDADSEANRTRSRQAYRLLHDLNIIPGTAEDGTLIEKDLRKWCNAARKLAEDAGRLEVCDCTIGQILAHSPEDSDGNWPCAAVRNVLEEICTDSLKSGFTSGKQNLRGANFRKHGGDQERVLMSKYRTFAEAIRFTFPFVAGALDQLADSYALDAKMWDERDTWEPR